MAWLRRRLKEPGNELPPSRSWTLGPAPKTPLPREATPDRAHPGPFVFISYSTENLDYVVGLEAHLRSHKIIPFYDKHIEPGAYWSPAIADWIKNCSAFIVVMSDPANESIWVKNEIFFAMQTRRPIVTLRLQGKPFLEVGIIQYEDVAGGRMPSARFIRKLQRLCDSTTPEPTPAPTTPGLDVSTTALGPLGAARISEMVGLDNRTMAARWTVENLLRLDSAIAQIEDPEHSRQARRTRDALVVGLQTVEMLRREAYKALEPARLTVALRTMGRTVPDLAGLETENDHVEYIALHHEGGPPGLRKWLARFVIALLEPGKKGRVPGGVLKWATAIDAHGHLAEALTWWQAARQDASTRLVISLHASRTGWPERVEAWWLSGKQTVKGGSDCEPRKAMVEEKIRSLIAWARHLSWLEGKRLTRIDFAVPTGLLTNWRPEEMVVHGQELFRDFTVGIAWAGRLREETAEQHYALRQRLDAVRSARNRRGWLTWWNHQQTRDLDTLHQEVGRQRSNAIGLRFHPAGEDPVLHTILESSPILVWPDRDADPGGIQHVEACWPDQVLVQELGKAYQERGERRPAPLAEWRAARDNEDWLDFCLEYLGHGRGGRPHEQEAGPSDLERVLHR